MKCFVIFDLDDNVSSHGSCCSVSIWDLSQVLPSLHLLEKVNADSHLPGLNNKNTAFASQGNKLMTVVSHYYHRQFYKVS